MGAEMYMETIKLLNRVGVVHSIACHCCWLQAVTVAQDYIAGDTLDSRHGEKKMGKAGTGLEVPPCWLVFTRSEDTMQAFGRVWLPMSLLAYGT